jgi:hypothetical protein
MLELMGDNLGPMILLGLPALGLLIAFISIPWLIKGEREKARNSPQRGVIDSMDEIFHPEARAARLLWQAQIEVPAPAPSPGDRILEEGKITIDIDDTRDEKSIS